MAVLRDPRHLLAAAAWSPVQGGYLIRVVLVDAQGLASPAGVHRVADRAGAVGVVLAGLARELGVDRLGCEDAYLGKNPRTALSLARWTGGVTAPVEEACGVTARWHRAGAWRKALLGLPVATPREQAKRASLAGMPLRVEGLRAVLGVLGELDHVADAAGVAVHEATTRR